MRNAPSKLALGTVQFGMPYGATNQHGQVSRDEVVRILKLAQVAGLNLLDTASTYGNSEEVLGWALQEAGLTSDFTVVSKVFLRPEHDLKPQVFGQVEKTLRDLRGASLESLMIHHGHQLPEFGESLAKILLAAKAEFKIAKLGASFYSPTELVKANEVLNLDVVQVPFNLFNQDFAQTFTPTLNPEVHVRSVFLQGVLLTPVEKRPSYFHRFANEFSAYDRELKRTGLSPLQLNLAHALATPWIDRTVLGVTSAAELGEIIDTLSTLPPSITGARALASHDPHLTNPANWKL